MKIMVRDEGNEIICLWTCVCEGVLSTVTIIRFLKVTKNTYIHLNPKGLSDKIFLPLSNGILQQHLVQQINSNNFLKFPY